MLLPSITKTTIKPPSHFPPNSQSTIPNPEPLGFPLDRRGRALLSVLSLGLIAGFCLAATLQPDPRGYGTHRQLGLPPCTVRLLFGIPCPSCGMTTSFASLMRGQLDQSFRANPAGLLLGLACAALDPLVLVERVLRPFVLDSTTGSRRRLAPGQHLGRRPHPMVGPRFLPVFRRDDLKSCTVLSRLHILPSPIPIELHYSFLSLA